MLNASNTAIRKSRHRWSKRKEQSPSKVVRSTSHANVRYLDTPERRLRFKHLKQRLSLSERKVKKRIEKLTEKDGLRLEPEVHDDMVHIINDMSSAVTRGSEDGSLKLIFWEQQLQAMKTPDTRQMRWHPAIIKLFHFKFKSGGAYESLRPSGVLTLPSERTLFDYSHWTESGPGFLADVNKQLFEEANVKEVKDRYVVISFDEMKIRENLVFHKDSMALIGFSDMGSFNNSLDDIELQLQGKCAVKTAEKVSKHMLAFMVRGLFTSLNFPYAHFPTKGATADQLWPI